jgi:predicted nucleic acid-binding protein
MAQPSPYLLDTNIVLHFTRRGSPPAAAVESQFGLTTSVFEPAICEVTVAEMWAFAQSEKWGDTRKRLLQDVVDRLVVLPISLPGVHQRWSKLYSHARSNGLAIQHDHNDVWIASTASVSGLTLLSMDASAFLPLRGTDWLNVIVLDSKTGAVRA